MSLKDDEPRNLVDLIRAVVNATIPEAVADSRTPRTLSGTVEDLDEDLDVVYIRMDSETSTSDPTQTDNYEAPGIIPATRLGETFRDEQVRVDFAGRSGASAMRTSIESRIVLPFGAESGRRILLDGDQGLIAFFDDSDTLVALLRSDRWVVGDMDTPGERLSIDPLGGIRMRDADDVLVSLIDQRGYSLRSPTDGKVTAEIASGSFRMVDPEGVDDIEMVTASTGTLPNPSFKSEPEPSPGSSLVAPKTGVLSGDLAVGHVAAWRRATNQGATMTPPTNWTERDDSNFADDVGTLQTSVATRGPAVVEDAQFTSTQSTWDHANGMQVVLRGAVGAVPAYRSHTTSTTITTATTVEVSIANPSGVTVGDVLVAFISLGVNGGFVPTGWTTPEGFVFLGANFSSSGSGATQSTVASGAWVKHVTESQPATHEASINLPAGTKMIQGTMVAIQGARINPGGVQIRLAGKPIRRQLDAQTLASPSLQLCDFQNIPPGYDHLEVVWDGSTNASSGAGAIPWRFNVDSGSNYFYRVVRNGSVPAGSGGTGFGANSMHAGGQGSTAGAKTAGSIHIYNYTTSPRVVVLGQNWWTDGFTINAENTFGQWDRTGPISRISAVVLGPTGSFAAGTRALLYGY